MRSRSRTITALAAATALLATGAPAASASGWTKPHAYPAGTEEPVPRAAIAADGTRAAAWSTRSGALVISAGDQRNRLLPPRLIVRKRPIAWSVAAAPGGAILVAWEERNGIHVTVRTAPGRKLTARRVATSTGSDLNGLQVVADPKGGWVIAEHQYPPDGTPPPREFRTRALSLGPGGAVVGPVQDLGPGSFGLDARPTAAVAVDGKGRAVLAFTRTKGIGDFGLPPAVVSTRPHGGAFSAPAELPAGDPGLIGEEPRVAVGPAGSAAVAYTRARGCGESACTGAPAVSLLGAGGEPGGPLGPVLDKPVFALAPSAAFTSATGGALVFQLKDHSAPLSTLAPVRAVNFRADGTIGKLQTLTTERAGEPVAVPLSRGRALALWVSRRRTGVALARKGAGFHRIAAPKGPPPDRFHRNSTNRDLRTAGRYAIFAWSRRDGVVRVSVRRF